MAVVQIGTPAATARSTTSPVTGAWGTGQNRTAGNTLVAIVCAAASTSVGATAQNTGTTGWSLYTEIANTSTAHARVAIWTKPAAGSDAAPAFTSTISGTGAMSCTLLELAGNLSGTPVDVVGSYASGSSAITVAVTATTSAAVKYAGELCVYACAMERATGTNTWTPGTNFTNLYNDGTTSSYAHFAVDTYAAGPASGSTASDAGAWTTATTAYAASVVIAFSTPVIQSGSSGGGASNVSLSQATTAGSTLIATCVSNNAWGTAYAVAGSNTYAMACAGFTAGHNGDYTGVWYLPNCPAGCTAVYITDSYSVGYIETTGLSTMVNPVCGTPVTGGSATAGTTFALANPGSGNAGEAFTIFAYGSDVSNSSTPWADGTVGHIMSAYGQFGYVTGAQTSAGTMPSGTWDGISVSFYSSATQATPAMSAPMNFLGRVGAAAITTASQALNVPLTAAVPAGATVFAVVSCSTGWASGFQDTKNNAWHTDVQTRASTPAALCALGRSYITTALTTSDSVTLLLNTAATGTVELLAWTGISPLVPCDILTYEAGSTTGAVTLALSGSVGTSEPYELSIIAASSGLAVGTTVTWTKPKGWTEQPTGLSPNNLVDCAWTVQNLGGAIGAPSFSQGTSAAGSMIGVSYRSAAANPMLVADSPPVTGVYRGPAGCYSQNGRIGAAQSGITAYQNWLGRSVSYVLDYLSGTPSWSQFTSGYLYKPNASFSTLNQWGSPGSAGTVGTPYVVAHGTSPAGWTGTKFTIPVTTQPNAGDMLVLCYGTGGTPTATAVQDTKGNTWAVGNGSAVSRSAGFCWTVTQPIRLTTSDTITLTISAAQNMRVSVIGIPGGRAIDVSPAGNGSGSSSTSASAATGTLQSTNEVCLAVLDMSGNTAPSGLSWTQIDQQGTTAGPIMTAAYVKPSSTATQTFSATLPSTSYDVAVCSVMAIPSSPLPAGQTMVLGLPACVGVSAGSGGATWAAEASGTNDSYWTTLGQNLVAWGFGQAVIRLGREFNGNWYQWAPGNTGDSSANYIAGYQHIVSLLRSIPGTNFSFQWNPSLAPGTMQTGTYTPSPTDTTQWYPGDAYVDSIGIDLYDWNQYSTQTAAPYGNRTIYQQGYSGTSNETGTDGINTIIDLAIRHGIPVAFPEWGLQLWLSGSNYYGGGDDAYFITCTADYMRWCSFGAMWEDLGTGLFDTDDYGNRVSGLQAPDASRTDFLTLLGGAVTGIPPVEFAGVIDAFNSAAAVPLAVVAGAADAISVSVSGPTATTEADAAGAVESLSVQVTVPTTEADTAAGRDQVAVSAAAPAADTAGAADALSVQITVPVSLADTAGGTEGLGTTAAVPLADVSAGSDTLTGTATAPIVDRAGAVDAVTSSMTGNAVSPADAAGAADVLAVAVLNPTTEADTAGAADALTVAILNPVSVADTAGSADQLAVTVFNPTAEADQGGAAESLAVTATLTSPDAAAAADAIGVAITVPVSLSDQGSATEAPLAITGTLTLSDDGSAVESVSKGTFPADFSGAVDQLAVSATAALADAGASVEIVTSGEQPVYAESAAAADALTVSVAAALTEQAGAADQLIIGEAASYADAAAAADALTVLATTPLTESAGGAEALSASAQTTAADAAAACEALSVAGTANPQYAENAGAAESLTVQVSGVSLADAAAALDLLALGESYTFADTAAGRDQAAVTASVPFAELASGSDTAAVTAAASLPDQAGAAEQISVAVGQVVSPADSAGAADSLAVTASVTAGDAGASADTLAAAAALSLAEQAGSADALAVAIGALASMADAAGAADSLAVTSGLAVADLAGATDQAAVTAVGTTLADSAGAADQIAVVAGAAVSQADSGAGADRLTVAASAIPADVAGTAETLAVTATSVQPDSASAVDSLATTAAVSVADASAALEALGVAISQPVTAADTAAGSDAIRVSVSVPLADLCGSGDVLSNTAVVALTDACGAADVLSVWTVIFHTGTVEWAALAEHARWQASTELARFHVKPAASRWRTEPVGGRWETRPERARWRVTMQDFDPVAAVSPEFVNVRWTSDLDGTTVDPTAQPLPCMYALPVSSGDTSNPAQATQWYEGTWLSGGTGKGYVQQCPVGPTTTGPTLASGTKYDVWAQVQGVPEAPKKFVGVLSVY